MKNDPFFWKRNEESSLYFCTEKESLIHPHEDSILRRPHLLCSGPSWIECLFPQKKGALSLLLSFSFFLSLEWETMFIPSCARRHSICLNSVTQKKRTFVFHSFLPFFPFSTPDSSPLTFPFYSINHPTFSHTFQGGLKKIEWQKY